MQNPNFDPDITRTTRVGQMANRYARGNVSSRATACKSRFLLLALCFFRQRLCATPRVSPRDYFNYHASIHTQRERERGRERSQSPEHESWAQASYRPNAFYISCASMIDRRVSLLPVRYARVFPRECQEAVWLIGLTWIIRIGRINCRIKLPDGMTDIGRARRSN